MASSRALQDITPYFVYLLVTATIGPLLFGYHLAELNAPQEIITCQKKSLSRNALTRLYSSVGFDVNAGSGDGYLPQCIEMDSVQFGLVSSFFTLGGFIGALSGGPATTQYGRLKAMIIS
ncbi:hypothetical protein KC343_g17841, partial [Hortaea werneckii]